MERRDYYLEILEAVRKRATCDRGMSGAILVRGNRLISAGYVGAPAGLPHCNDVGHEMMVFKHYPKPPPDYPKKFKEIEKITTHCIRTVHAEANAILQAAREGIQTGGAELYCTMFPCYECAKMIINVGIFRVISTFDYQDSQRSKDIFSEAGVGWECLNGEMNYDNSGHSRR